MKTTDRPPLLYSIARSLIRYGVPGGRHLLRAAQHQGVTRCTVRYRLDARTELLVPLHLGEAYHWFDRRFIAEYERETIAALAAAIVALPRPITFVDCGADFGLFSVMLARAAPALDIVHAFEPNPQVHDVLAANLDRLGTTAHVHRAALADFDGAGTLRSPGYDDSVHARFLVPASDGDVAVRTLDGLDLPAGGGIAMKIDVEGGELAIVRGARATLQRAAGFAIAFEAHADVALRTGIDPCDVLREIAAVRPCTTLIPERPGFRVRPDVPFFRQPHGLGICNLVCSSAPA
jgi:FkbM family methyltransferase